MKNLLLAYIIKITGMNSTHSYINKFIYMYIPKFKGVASNNLHAEEVVTTELVTSMGTDHHQHIRLLLNK